MRKKKMLLLCMLFVVSVAGQTKAQIGWTDENGVAGNHNWSDPGNWSTNEVPGEFDTIHINYSDYSNAPEAHGPIIDSNVGWVAHLKIGASKGDAPAVLTVNEGGLLRIKQTGQWPQDNGHLLLGQGQDAAGTIMMTGGKIVVDTMCQLGKRPGQGLIKISGNAEFIVNGGLKLGGRDNGTGDALIQLDGGTVKCKGISFYQREGKMDITAGKLIAGPDRLGGFGTMENYIKMCVQENRITAYSGKGTVKWKQDSPEKGWIEVWAELEPQQPQEPNSPGK